MKMRIASLFAFAFGVVLVAPKAVAQPILSVNMTEIDVPSNAGVGAPTVFGGNPIYSTGGTNPLNGAYGAFGNLISMYGLATGTNPAGGFSYVFFVNGTPDIFAAPFRTRDKSRIRKSGLQLARLVVAKARLELTELQFAEA